MNKTRRYTLLAALAIFGILSAIYTINPNRWRTQQMLESKGKHTGKDFMLSSLNVTAIAQDTRKLIWIGTSAGINVYNGHDYIQFFHDSEDSTALPDDYINVLHRDKKGRMWIGTQNGLARYESGYRFHRFTLPSANSNILEIEDAHHRAAEGAKDAEEDAVEDAVTVSNGQERFLVEGDEVKKLDSPKAHSTDEPFQKAIKEKRRKKIERDLKDWIHLYPDFLLSLNKPKELISTTFKDAGGNLWIGYRNAGHQVISENVIAYKYANRNPLADATRGMDITAVQTVGNHILAGTTLRLFVYEAKKGEPNYYYYEKNTSLNNIVPLDDNQFWVVGNSYIKSCRILPGNQLATLGTFRSSSISSNTTDGSSQSNTTDDSSLSSNSPSLGCGTRQASDVYVSCQAPYIIKYPFGAAKAEFIACRSSWYDAETQLTTLQDGRILLFMKNMHLAILSPATQKITELEVSGAPKHGNIDPAFARQDSRGNIWLGTKRAGLYRFTLKDRKLEKMDFVNDVHVQGLLEDDRHQIWITTLKNAICYQPASGAVLMNSLVSSSQNEWNRQYFDNSICISPTGNLVFGSSDGCIFLPQEAGDQNLMANKKVIANKEDPDKKEAEDNKENLGNQKQPGNQHLEIYDQSKALEKGLRIYSLDVKTKDGEALAMNDDVHDGDSYTLAYDENDLSLSFFYPNYSRRSSLMFQYKLEGYDKNWREPSYDHTARFANLSPGRYTFRLRLVNSEHLPALAEQSIEITILPAPWFSAAAWWFYFCCLVLLLSYIASLYLHIRTNRMLLLQEQHEREREQRTNEMNMNFFANISHEFRNPITIIAGPLLSLKQDKSLPAQAQKTLNRVCLSVNRMLKLIDQMLDFNQLETDALRLKVAKVDVRKELLQLIASFEESTRVRGIRLETRFEDGKEENSRIGGGEEESNYLVWLDADKLEKVMDNLFTNALKHTGNQGIIRITASCRDGRLMVSIFNNGEPIEESRLKDVFKRYYQLSVTEGNHHYGWGTGIGLYYVKRLIGLHHGEISVRNVISQENGENEEDETRKDGASGVEFSFWIPVDQSIYTPSEQVKEKTGVMQIPLDDIHGISTEEEKEAEEKPSTDSAEESSESPKKPKILVVDDDIDVAQYITSLLSHDYTVVNRYSAEEALADLEQVKPDLILSDIIMGKMSGYDFCKTIKQNLLFSHIPVILITAKSNMNEQITGLRLGAVAYITKPFDPLYLKAMVQTQLHNMATLRKGLVDSTDTETLDAPVANTLSDQDRKFMDELYALMEKRSAEMELNVTTVCHDLLISQSKFSYKLKELTGETPGSFFRRYKLNKAARLLLEGQYNVSEVAVMIGFNTAAHFSVAFKKQFGVTPSEFQSSSHS